MRAILSNSQIINNIVRNAVMLQYSSYKIAYLFAKHNSNNNDNYIQDCWLACSDNLTGWAAIAFVIIILDHDLALADTRNA